MTHHIAAAKLTFVTATTAAGAAAAAIVASNLDWSVIIAGVCGAIISSTFSGLVLIFVNRRLNAIHDTVNHLADARVIAAERASHAEGMATGRLEGLSEAKETAKDVLAAAEKK